MARTANSVKIKFRTNKWVDSELVFENVINNKYNFCFFVYSSGRGPQRQFQDKSYFMGVLRSKMSELTSELSSMKSQIAAATEEQSTFLTYDKR